MRKNTENTQVSFNHTNCAYLSTVTNSTSASQTVCTCGNVIADTNRKWKAISIEDCQACQFFEQYDLKKINKNMQGYK